MPSGAALPMPRWDAASRPAGSPSEEPGPPLAVADWGRGLEKTISWRVVGTLADIAVAYAFTGSVALSGALALTGSVVNAALYFSHELVWDALDPSGRRQPAVLEVPAIGSTS